MIPLSPGFGDADAVIGGYSQTVAIAVQGSNGLGTDTSTCNQLVTTGKIGSGSA